MICQAEPLDRVFLQLGPFTIYWYGVIIALGLFLGLFLATREANRLGLKKDYIIDLVVIATPVAIIFARIYYVIFEWDMYANGPLWKIFAIWEGGIAIHGALIGAVLTAVIYARYRNISFWQLADITAPSIILGQAIGRWGNFMNQEAHGGPISEATYEKFHQYLPDFIMDQMCIDGVMYHPTFLYESVWNLIVFGLLLLLRRYNPYRGEVFLSYVIFYSIGRIFVEALRTDSLWLGPIKQAQFFSILLIVGSLIILFYRRNKKIVDRRYDGTKISRK